MLNCERKITIIIPIDKINGCFYILRKVLCSTSIAGNLRMKRSTFEQYVTEYCEDLAVKENAHQYKRCRHACVLTYNDAIISSGVNSKLFNDFTKQYNDLKALHAEPVAIMRAMKHHSKIIHKCELWVCRNNEISKESRPCPMCMRIIKNFRIKRIHYTTGSGEWKEETLE